MTTAAQAQPMGSNSASPSTSPTRKLFPMVSSRSVASIIVPRRRSSHADFDSKTQAPVQRRSVSNPLQSHPEPERRSTATIPQSESAPARHMHSHHLTFPHVANIFVKLRRVQKKVKAHHIDSSSGETPVTHSSLTSPALNSDDLRKLARLEIQDIYVCADAVDTSKLLRATRTSLLDRASPLHANILIDEQWASSICGPKHRSDGSFRVHVRYTATAAFSTSRKDPRQPVALEETRNVPGLMTIISRDTINFNIIELYSLDAS